MFVTRKMESQKPDGDSTASSGSSEKHHVSAFLQMNWVDTDFHIYFLSKLKTENTGADKALKYASKLINEFMTWKDRIDVHVWELHLEYYKSQSSKLNSAGRILSSVPFYIPREIAEHCQA